MKSSETKTKVRGVITILKKNYIILFIFFLSVLFNILPSIAQNDGKNCGFLSHPDLDFTVYLTASDGTEITCDSKDKKISVPAGKYILGFIGFTKYDSSGNNWYIASNYLGDELNIVQGQTIEINKYGEPFQFGIVVDGSNLSFNIKGRSGEGYTSAYYNDGMLDAPSFKIVGPDGGIIEEGSFKYG